MRIAIKAVQISQGGGLTHLNKIIKWFGRLAPDVNFYLLCKPGQEKLFVSPPANFKYIYYKFPALNLPSQLFWERQLLPGILRDLGVDLLFEPGNRGTLKSPCPKVTLLHNIAPFDREYVSHETAYQGLRNSLLRRSTLQSMRQSDGIIFLSEYCREYFRQYIDLLKIKSRVIYHGKSDVNYSTDTSVFGRFGINGEYILSVSDIWRYKKIKEMVQSYLLALSQRNDLPSLIIAGKNHSPDYMKEIIEIIKATGTTQKIIFTGFLGQGELGALYSRCRAFLFPSVLESFSIILVEAMNWGCAVAASNRSAVPEVTGGAALYFNPDAIDDFATKIISIATEDRFNLALREKARERARFFSWEKTASQTLSFFHDVASDGKTKSLGNPGLTTVEKQWSMSNSH